MLLLRLCLVVACALATANASAMDDQLSSGVGFFVHTWEQKWDLSVDLGEDDLRESPAWPPETANPPCSARKAIATARAGLPLSNLPEEYQGEPIAWKLASATLAFARLPNDEAEIRWYWIVEFERKINGRETQTLPLVVLMDGKLITPTFSPYTERIDDP